MQSDPVKDNRNPLRGDEYALAKEVRASTKFYLRDDATPSHRAGRVTLPRLGLVYMTAFHCCQSCQVKEACRKWLDSMPCSVANAPNFCPSEDILFELAR
jgi:hypothetical protein